MTFRDQRILATVWKITVTKSTCLAIVCIGLTSGCSSSAPTTSQPVRLQWGDEWNGRDSSDEVIKRDVKTNVHKIYDEFCKVGVVNKDLEAAVDEIAAKVMQFRPNWNERWLRAALLRDVTGNVNMPYEDYVDTEFWSGTFWLQARGQA